ncbi:hypothetical protein [Nesterenkonia sp. HG001]|uniref:hypothetical protein n=1 Tax=Nesterenkonia sp. HG001 TaxID=2983207 RepID=UPI002AC5B941|nr:hypothetical protein [Nesterenkonia sp. HG001]MDZ5077860.1 hypothetical protein [Nesterenkonia sp. HG001]
MRLQRPLHTPGGVRRITLRIRARDLPATARIDITDVQLQPGKPATGVTVSPREVGTRPGGRQYRNAVIQDGLEVVALANLDAATPVQVGVATTSPGDVRVGSYRFGEVDGTAEVDGRRHKASQGWGRPPIITRRSDLWVRTETDDRAHLRLAWEDREPE